MVCERVNAILGPLDVRQEPAVTLSERVWGREGRAAEPRVHDASGSPVSQRRRSEGEMCGGLHPAPRPICQRSWLLAPGSAAVAFPPAVSHVRDDSAFPLARARTRLGREKPQNPGLPSGRVPYNKNGLDPEPFCAHCLQMQRGGDRLAFVLTVGPEERRS